MKILGETPPEIEPAGGLSFNVPMPLGLTGSAGLTLLPPRWPPARATGPATAPPPFPWEAVAGGFSAVATDPLSTPAAVWLELVSALLATWTPASAGAFPLKLAG
jgi:hypothetical protein